MKKITNNAIYHLHILTIIMAIGRTRTNLRAEIENWHDIIAIMIDDISIHYQEQYVNIEIIANNEAEEQSKGDHDIYSTIIDSYASEIERRAYTSFHAHQILFCTIYSYFETMLNRIIHYRFTGGKMRFQDTKSILNAICNDYYKRFGVSLHIEYADIVKEFYRLLRNCFMHGKLYDKEKELQLKHYCEENDSINFNGDIPIILDNSFLIKALNNVFKVLIQIDDAYSS